MSRLSKLRKEFNVSGYVMSQLLGITVNYYSEIENEKETNLPPYIRERIDGLLQNKYEIEEYKRRLSSWVNEHRNDDVLKLYNKTIEDISNDTLISIPKLKAFILKGKPMSDIEEDMFIDYMTYLDSIKKSESVNTKTKQVSEDWESKFNDARRKADYYRDLSVDLVSVIHKLSDLL